MQKRSDGSNARPAALFLTPEAPYPTAGGGALRSASLLEYLARRYEVDVIVFREPGAPDPVQALPHGLVRHVWVIELPYHSKHPIARMARNAGRVFRSIPPLNDRFGGFAGAITDVLRGRHYDVSVIEHFWCAPYWEQVTPHSRSVVLDLHNIESALLEGCARVESLPAGYALRRFHRACLDLERRWFPYYDLLLTPSEQDAVRVRSIAPGRRVHVYPNSIPFTKQPGHEEEDVIVFSGNLEYYPNVSALRFFRKRVWPVLRGQWPGLAWRVIGKNPRAVRRLLDGDPRIQLLGPVEDAVEALAAAKIAVVPMLAGSGTRVKILEAWAAGRAVVSTTLGAEGIPGRHEEHFLLADGPERFAAAVSRLLASPNLRRSLGSAGRALYEAEFTWESAWSRLEDTGI